MVLRAVLLMEINGNLTQCFKVRKSGAVKAKEASVFNIIL